MQITPSLGDSAPEALIPLFKYEDKHSYASNTHYSVTNECSKIQANYLKGKRFNLSGGIASGGEIPLLALLTRSKRCVVVDHSYTSLGAFYLKALMIQKYGGLEFVRLMETYPTFLAAARSVLPLIPDQFKVQMEPSPAPEYSNRISNSILIEMRVHWKAAHPMTLASLKDALPRLTLVHGDLTDLAAYGKFDALYLSNAFGHVGRTKKSPVVTEVDALLKENALILSTEGPYNKPTHWKELHAKAGTRGGWTHRLIQRLAPLSIPALVKAMTA